MDGTAHPRVESLMAFGLATLLAVWVGGSIVVDAAVVPSAFHLLPRQQAADLGAALFHRWNFVEGIAGVLAVFFAVALGRSAWGTARRHRSATVLLLGMTLVALVFLLVLTPAITFRLDALEKMGVDLADRTAMPPERRTLRTLHTLYAGLDVLKVCSGLVVIWLLANRRGR